MRLSTTAEPRPRSPAQSPRRSVDARQRHQPIGQRGAGRTAPGHDARQRLGAQLDAEKPHARDLLRLLAQRRPRQQCVGEQSRHLEPQPEPDEGRVDGSQLPRGLADPWNDGGDREVDDRDEGQQFERESDWTEPVGRGGPPVSSDDTRAVHPLLGHPTRWPSILLSPYGRQMQAMSRAVLKLSRSTLPISSMEGIGGCHEEDHLGQRVCAAGSMREQRQRCVRQHERRPDLGARRWRYIGGDATDTTIAAPPTRSRSTTSATCRRSASNC